MNRGGGDAEKTPGFGETLLSLARRWNIAPELIMRLQRESELFREICLDYEECHAKLKSLEMGGLASRRQIEDYREMESQLERDVLRSLEVDSRRRES